MLRNISFRLAAGEVLGLLGRTGSGKSTLTRLLLRLVEPTSGAIYLEDESLGGNGVALNELPLRELRSRVGMVTQEVQLFQASIRDNLTFFDQTVADKMLWAMANELGLAEWLASLPDGLDTMLGADGQGLSAGQAQLVAFLRIGLQNPGVLALAFIILLEVSITLLAGIGLGGANATGFYLYKHSIRAWLFGNVFAHILDQPGAQPLPTEALPSDSTGGATEEAMSVGVALNTLRDDADQIFYFDIEMTDFFGFGLTAIVAFVAMFQMSVPITLGVFAPLIAIIVVANRLSERIERYREESREATGQATGAIGEIFGAVQAIQVNNAEARIMAHFRQLNEARRVARVQDQLLTRLVDALAGNMVVIGTALVLNFGGTGHERGSLYRG